MIYSDSADTRPIPQSGRVPNLFLQLFARPHEQVVAVATVGLRTAAGDCAQVPSKEILPM